MRLFIAFIIFISLIPFDGFTHGGGLDSNGGHYNRKTGEYHQHKQPSSDRSTRSTFQEKSSVSQLRAVNSTPHTAASLLFPSERSQKTNEYFSAANENVGALSCGIVIHERNLDPSTKQAVKRRDGNCCVICGSTVKLEVDHMRGLQNGGSNDMSNLATLCDDCHTEKTKMDGSLRRKRDKICRGN